MARHVFFSFHYQRDIFRVNQVRRIWEFPGRKPVGFWDDSLWEKTKLRGPVAIKALIDNALIGTSVTIVLIGEETASRRYVNYEIQQSHLRGNGMLGIHISQLDDQFGRTSNYGTNPFEQHVDPRSGQKLSEIYPVYRWYSDDGRDNIGIWIERAAIRAGR